MEVRSLLDFLNSVKNMHVLKFATCGVSLVSFLDITSLDEQFTQRIDAGLIYVYEKSPDNYILVDGLSRFLSLSLLLHAICECYKKTSSRNDKAIKIIRRKYLFNGSKTKLRLPEEYQSIYEKIINGERLSGKEKRHPMFTLLHNMWSQIKEYDLHAAEIFTMLKKVTVTVVNAENIDLADLYYSINHEKKSLNHLLLIQNFLESTEEGNFWNDFNSVFNNNENDIIRFFKDFFLSKFNYKELNKDRLYEYFVNYINTMSKYLPITEIMNQMVKAAKLYKNMLNINIENEKIKKAMIKLKMLNGEDTYAYLLSIYSDYVDGTLSEATFLEILETIEDYLQKRKATPNNVTFNELIQYLNAFITCK